MPTSVNAALNDDIIAERALQAFTDELTALGVFSTDFSNEVAEKGDTVNVPLVENLSASTTENDYETASGGLQNIPVSLNKYQKATVGLTDAQFHNSSAARLERFAAQQGKAVARAMLVDVWSLITAANFAAEVELEDGVLSSAIVRQIRKDMNAAGVPKADRGLVLGSDQYDNILGDTTVQLLSALHYGGTEAVRDGVIPKYIGFTPHESAIIPDNGEDLVGFACHPAAIAFAARVLQPQAPNEYLESRVVNDEQTGLAMGYRRHYAPGKGTHFCTFEAVYGYAVGISGALTRLQEVDNEA